MASLLFAAGILTYNKVQQKREQKKEKKKLTYETRYNELEREHTRTEEKYRQRRQTGESIGADEKFQRRSTNPFENSDPVAGATVERRRSSSESQRESSDSKDDPGAWVDHVIRQRSKQNTGSTT